MTLSTIVKYIEKVNKGDATAYEILNKENRSLVRKANKRLINLRKHGINYGAIENAEHFIANMLEQKNFSKDTKRLLNDGLLRQQLAQLNKFLSAKTSTVRGVKKYERSILKGFEEKYGIKLDSDSKKKEFLTFLNSEGFAEYKKYDSEGGIETALKAIDSGERLEDFYKLYEDYVNGKILYLDDVFLLWSKEVTMDDLKYSND